MVGGSVLALVDSLIAAEKTLQGVPDWQVAANSNEYRLVMPVFVDGKSSEANVEIDAYPNSPILRFRIMLNMDKCVWRIDYTEYERHVNPVDTFTEIVPYSFTEPHFHSWQDNRRYCTKSSTPKKLLIARPLPEQIRKFDAAFRWFCGELNISQLPSNMIELPPRTTLI